MPQDIEIERRLAAVLAADVAGFSRLTEADEIGTMRLLAAQRTILDSAIGRHRGRIANTAGDSVLAEFPSAVNAVQCAVEAQQALRDAAEGAPDDKRVLFRIGIHVGDVMVRHGDLLGSGVNVAARLEGLADAGGIVISAAAHEQVKKILPLAYADLGPQQVKNIEEPVRAFAIGSAPVAMAATVPGDGKPLPLPDRPSIAVLPFQNMSGDPEQEYFADGMVEDIITALSRFKSLFVIARNSSFTYKGKAVDIKQVGRELGVRYVLEGSVRKAAGRVRITGQLIEAATGAHLWADRFDGAIQDVFDLQDSVTERVVTAILPTLQSVELARVQQKRPESLDAYDSFLLARAVLSKRGRDTTDEALAHLQHAIALAPGYAMAHALSADCYTRLYIEGTHTDFDETRSRALYFARKAIDLDSDDSEVLTYAALTLGNFDDVERAIRLGERAVTLNPNSAFGWYALGAGVMYLGDHTRAIECEMQSLRLSPTGPNRARAMAILAMSHFMKGNAADSHEWAERAFQENPNLPIGLRALALSCIAIGDRARARMAFEQFATDFPKQLERMKEMMRRPEDFERFESTMRLAANS